MNKTKLTFLFLVLMSMVGIQALASNIKVGGIYYNFDTSSKTAEVTLQGYKEYTYALSIPSEVTYEGTKYSVTSIGDNAFYRDKSLTYIGIPNSVTSIGYRAFADCSSLHSVTIPNSVTSIGKYAFSNCLAFTSVTIPSGVTRICEGVFKGCDGLTSVTIPNSVTTIGESAFAHCTRLTSITIPNVTSISSNAFYGCSKLTSVTVSNTAPVTILSSVFTNQKNATLYVPMGSKSAYETAKYWKDFKEIVEIVPAGIDQIIIDGLNNVKIFTLDGKRISKPKKGFNIIDGKKVFVR